MTVPQGRRPARRFHRAHQRLALPAEGRRRSVAERSSCRVRSVAHGRQDPEQTLPRFLQGRRPGAPTYRQVIGDPHTPPLHRPSRSHACLHLVSLRARYSSTAEVEQEDLSWLQSNVDEVITMLQQSPGLPSVPEVSHFDLFIETPANAEVNLSVQQRSAVRRASPCWPEARPAA